MWMDHDLHEILKDYLFSANPLYTDFIRKKFVTDLYERRVHISDQTRAKILYSILCLEVWNRQLITDPQVVLTKKQLIP